MLTRLCRVMLPSQRTASTCHALSGIIAFVCSWPLPPLPLTSAVNNVRPAVGAPLLTVGTIICRNKRRRRIERSPTFCYATSSHSADIVLRPRPSSCCISRVCSNNCRYYQMAGAKHGFDVWVVLSSLGVVGSPPNYSYQVNWEHSTTSQLLV